MDFVVSVPLDASLAEMIGKKGTQNGLIFYDRKEQGNIIVALAPSSLNDKFYGLAESILVADQVIISTSDIGKLFGEAVVACSLVKRRTMFTDENIDKNMLDANIKEYSIVQRSNVMNEILSYTHVAKEGEARIDIDKCFPVKGVGVVALGIVKSGTVHKHDKLFHSSGKQVEIRSIQSHDDDIESAGYGVRVGIALKGIEATEVEKGDMLTKSNVGKRNIIDIELKQTNINREAIQKGKKYGFVSSFTFVYTNIESIEGNRATLKLDTNVPVIKGDELFLIRDASPRIFASGVVL